MNHSALLVGRILLSLVFLIAGYRKLMAVAASAGYFGKLGFPMPEVLVWIAIAVELGGAILLIVGLEDALGGVAARAVHLDRDLRRASLLGGRRRAVRQPDESLPEEHRHRWRVHHPRDDRPRCAQRGRPAPVLITRSSAAAKMRAREGPFSFMWSGWRTVRSRRACMGAADPCVCAVRDVTKMQHYRPTFCFVAIRGDSMTSEVQRRGTGMIAKTPVCAVASYRVIVLGYSVGMVLSLLGHVPAALLFITTAGLAAGALFVSEVLFSARSTAR